MDRIESRIERQIREARESGAFDDLPGAGKPLPGRGEEYDEDWWLKEFVRGEALAARPAALIAVGLERDRLADTVDRLPTEARVRAYVEELYDRIVRARRGRDDVEMSTVEVERIVRG